MHLIKATTEDFSRLRDFYIYVIDNTETIKTCCRWIYGLYPADDIIMDYIESGDMYYCGHKGKIIAAIALCQKQEADYHDVPGRLTLKTTKLLWVISCVWIPD